MCPSTMIPGPPLSDIHILIRNRDVVKLNPAFISMRSIQYCGTLCLHNIRCQAGQRVPGTQQQCLGVPVPFFLESLPGENCSRRIALPTQDNVRVPTSFILQGFCFARFTSGIDRVYLTSQTWLSDAPPHLRSCRQYPRLV